MSNVEIKLYILINDLRAIFVNDDNKIKHEIVVNDLTQQSSLIKFKNKKKNKIF